MNINRKVFYNQINPDAKSDFKEFILTLCPCFSKYFNEHNLDDTDYIPNLGNSSDSSIDTVEEYNESYQTLILSQPENIENDKLWVFVEK